MERGSITKWLFLALAIFFLVTQGKSLFFGSKASELQPFAGIRDDTVPAQRAPEQMCTLEGPRFRAELSTRGASLRHFILTDKRFESDHKPMDLVSASLQEPRLPLRTDLRTPEDQKLPAGAAPEGQVAFDDFDWKLDPKLQPADGKACVFTYEDATTSLKKIVALTGKPYELAVEVDVKNLAPQPKKHRFTLEQDSWQLKKDVAGGFMSRPSEHLSETVIAGTKVERLSPSDFEPGEFKKPEFTAEKWRRAPGPGDLAAVNSIYFTKLVVPQGGPGTPAAEAQIEDRWDITKHPKKEDDPNFGYLYRSRLAYPEAELAPGQTATYRALAYAGPKERELLAAIGHDATEVLNLGTFATIARGLVWYLEKLYSFTRSWGLAIVLLTMTVRVLLFPLSLSQIKNSMAMRRLKPEMDAVNEKYKDDAAQRGLAIQELWRKNGVSNPVIGCLPMLLQMPVWWALYTALQTAVQLYHVPFLWFADLTAPDRFYIVPLVLGASSFFQQKLMPAQGDPQQQKMMLYMMPGIFTFMMLFLPSGLGVYMLTNSVLAIAQQLLVEKYLKSHEGRGGGSGQIEVREKTSSDGDKPAPLGKGKARARG